MFSAVSGSSKSKSWFGIFPLSECLEINFNFFFDFFGAGIESEIGWDVEVGCPYPTRFGVEHDNLAPSIRVIVKNGRHFIEFLSRSYHVEIVETVVNLLLR